MDGQRSLLFIGFTILLRRLQKIPVNNWDLFFILKKDQKKQLRKRHVLLVSLSMLLTDTYISQFLSPHHNQRTDEWGRLFANRMRFLVETYKEIRKQVGESFPIGIKLNSADFENGGFAEDESVEVMHENVRNMD